MDNGLIQNADHFNLGLYKPNHATKYYAIKANNTNSEINGQVQKIQEAIEVINEFNQNLLDSKESLIEYASTLFSNRASHSYDLYNNYLNLIDSQISVMLDSGKNFLRNILQYNKFLSMPSIEGVDGTSIQVSVIDIIDKIDDIKAQLNSFNDYKSEIEENNRKELEEYRKNNPNGGVGRDFVVNVNHLLHSLNLAIDNIFKYIKEIINAISGNGGAVEQYEDYRREQSVIYQKIGQIDRDNRNNLPRMQKRGDNSPAEDREYYSEQVLKRSPNNDRFGHSGSVPSNYKPGNTSSPNYNPQTTDYYVFPKKEERFSNNRSGTNSNVYDKGKDRFSKDKKSYKDFIKNMDVRVKNIMDRAIAQLGLE